jgi:hypothetical protein
MRGVVAQSAGDAARGVGLFSDRRVCVTPPPVKTVLRTGRSNDTSPPAGCCGGTVVPGEEPVRDV